MTTAVLPPLHNLSPTQQLLTATTTATTKRTCFHRKTGLYVLQFHCPFQSPQFCDLSWLQVSSISIFSIVPQLSKAQHFQLSSEILFTPLLLCWGEKSGRGVQSKTPRVQGISMQNGMPRQQHLHVTSKNFSTWFSSGDVNQSRLMLKSYLRLLILVYKLI